MSQPDLHRVLSVTMSPDDQYGFLDWVSRRRPCYAMSIEIVFFQQDDNVSFSSSGSISSSVSIPYRNSQDWSLFTQTSRMFTREAILSELASLEDRLSCGESHWPLPDVRPPITWCFDNPVTGQLMTTELGCHGRYIRVRFMLNEVGDPIKRDLAYATVQDEVQQILRCKPQWGDTLLSYTFSLNHMPEPRVVSYGSHCNTRRLTVGEPKRLGAPSLDDILSTVSDARSMRVCKREELHYLEPLKRYSATVFLCDQVYILEDYPYAEEEAQDVECYRTKAIHWSRNKECCFVMEGRQVTGLLLSMCQQTSLRQVADCSLSNSHRLVVALSYIQLLRSHFEQGRWGMIIPLHQLCWDSSTRTIRVAESTPVVTTSSMEEVLSIALEREQLHRRIGQVLGFRMR